MFIDKCTLQGSEKRGHSNLKLKLNIEFNIKKQNLELKLNIELNIKKIKLRQLPQYL